MSRKILVIEDDAEIAELARLHLQDQGYEVELAHDGATGCAQALRTPWDLVILDLMLPGMDGLDICRQLRQRHEAVPLLILTARSAEVDRILGLEMGADDYMTKPVSFRELVARVRALLRRVEAVSASVARPTRLEHGPLSIDPGRRSVQLDGRSVGLTAKEFDLLLFLASHPGHVFSRAQLLDVVWGYGYDGYEHTVNSHINRLRSKIERDPTQPRLLLTVWGIGYKLNEELKS